MLAASKVKMSGSAKKKKKNVDNNTYDISSIKRVTRNSKFQEVSTFSRAIHKETAEKCTKKSALQVQRFFFWLLDLLLFFLPFSLPLPVKVITNINVTRTIRNNDL